MYRSLYRECDLFSKQHSFFLVKGSRAAHNKEGTQGPNTDP